VQINPKVAIWLNIIYVILSGITAQTLQSLGISNYQVVLAWAGAIAAVLNIVVHAFSSSEPGPLAPPDPPNVKAAMEANLK
jgi:hypothetical protein